VRLKNSETEAAMGKIYTKGGDKGSTSLYGGTRIKKSSARVAAYGAVDEANAAIGVAAAYIGSAELEELLRLCQRKLFLIGADLASDDRGRGRLKERIAERDAVLLETAIDAFSEKLPPNTQFIVPGRSVRSACLHVARTAVRRAERCIVGVREEARVTAEILIFMNRLSDLLFIMSRVVDELAPFANADRL